MNNSTQPEKINRPEELPDCKIINTLIEKANRKTDYEFKYAHELDAFRKRISIEVSRIDLLFPEYTPHDEKYHLKKLFYVADGLLGDSVIENMNVTELFLLSISLYGHDWGMAISEEEKQYILSGCTGPANPNINLLDDEENRIREFCKSKNIKPETIELADWQEYVRVTHAFRSGKRIKAYFEPISSGVAEYAARICEGHWLDFDVIDDYTSYPTDVSIHRDIVNLKALTIYVRLADLLDLGEDRTPFILWKFVAPRNKFSKMEWEKHRSLQPVTFPTYQLARYIQVDGSTVDHNVYMSIMDLKRYIDNQFRQCSDVLNRMNDDYHKLDISHIDWRIAARGFEPIAIQFEFDRNRMFDILGDEIYRGNPYVFVRELLQNAIDAIEMRMEIYAKKDLAFKPKIEIEVVEETDLYIVKVTDNGIGMDQYIIRNYLSVAGKSYYKSTDFHKEDLKMDPISRFGIGVLSCFMVSDYIEIRTFKDPNTTPKQERLKISIPSKENYFRIEKNKEQIEVGSSFKVFVLKEKLPNEKKTESPIELNIASYVKKIAGFVKFPISIIEKGMATIVNYPSIEGTYTTSSQVYKIDYTFPIDRAIVPQHTETTLKYFSEKRFYLRSDLGLTKYDGCITFLLPKSEHIDFVNSGHSWPAREVTLVNYKALLNGDKEIKWDDQWVSFSRGRQTEEEITIPDRSYRVFLDGIMLQEISPPEIIVGAKEELQMEDVYRFHSMSESFLIPQLIVNIPKPVGMKIDLARTNIESNEPWDKPIWVAFVNYLKLTLLPNIAKEPPQIRLLSFAKFVTFYRLSHKIIIDNFIDIYNFPMPFLTTEGVLVFEDFDIRKSEIVKLVPNEFKKEFFSLLQSNYIEYRKYNGVLNSWEGAKVLFDMPNGRYLENTSASMNNIAEFLYVFMRKYYYLESIELISSPLGGEFPLVQEVLRIRPEDPKNMDHFATIATNIERNRIDAYSVDILYSLLNKKFHRFPKIVALQEDFTKYLGYSLKYLNLNNVIIRLFVGICFRLIEAREKNSLPKDLEGKLFDMINTLPFIYYDYDHVEINLNDLNTRFNDIFKQAAQMGLVEKDNCLNVDIKFTDFIKNSISVNAKGKAFKLNFEFSKYLKGTSGWGKPILIR